MKLLGGFQVVLLLALASCAVVGQQTLEEGFAIETPLEIRKQFAENLDRRLIERDIRLRPVIGTRFRMSAEERLVVSNFIGLMPNASFTLEGRPNYILEIKKRRARPVWAKSSGLKTSAREVTYTISLRMRSGREAVSEASQTGICNISEAVLTYPTRCSLLEPLLLQRALEKL